MNIQKHYAFTAELEEAGLLVKVYRLDYFCESYSEYAPEYTFHTREYETECGQKITLVLDKPHVCILHGKTKNFYLRIIKSDGHPIQSETET